MIAPEITMLTHADHRHPREARADNAPAVGVMQLYQRQDKAGNGADPDRRAELMQAFDE
jgi:hypothetical protein